MQVLVVEDDTNSRKALVRLMARSGVKRIIEAGSVEEGKRALSHNLCVILLDLMLPDGFGDEVAREAKKQKLPCKIVVCTAMDKFSPHMKDWSPDAVFKKPFNFDAVLAMVKDCVEGNSMN